LIANVTFNGVFAILVAAFEVGEFVEMGILTAFAGVAVAGDELLIFVGEAFVGVVDFVKFVGDYG
jgi:hypothetical protein